MISVAALHIIHCPFHKVEESFNTQAIHDIINIFPQRLPSTSDAASNVSEKAIRSEQPWDHILFPGVVPRTFVGALLIGLPLKLIKYLMSEEFLGSTGSKGFDHDFTSQFILQISSRITLAAIVMLSLGCVSRSLHKRYGLSFRICFLISIVSQFHYMYYAGRFVPNTFTAVLANIILSSWIQRQYSKAILFIALNVMIFRADTALFYGWLLVDAVFIKKQISLLRVLRVGIPTGLVAILISLTVDSIFWSKLTLPELEGLYFNVWLNKSLQWGTQPFFWYIYSCLPRVLIFSAPFIFLAEHKITRDYLIPTLAFILTYSILPHKELRFILFIVPILNISVASGLVNVHYYLNYFFLLLHSKLFHRSPSKEAQKKKLIGKQPTRKLTETSYVGSILFSIIILAMFLANLLGTFVYSRVSNHNYPGGLAALSLGMTKELLTKAEESVKSHLVDAQNVGSDVGVYINNLAAQTGVSRFVQVNGVYYAKTSELNETTFIKPYSLLYLVLEPKEIIQMMKNYCPLESNRKDLFERNLELWKSKNKKEIKCTLPNQSQMYCSIQDTIRSFKSIDVGAILKQIVQAINFPDEPFYDDQFIKTNIALHLIRCSANSISNPFT